MTLLELIHRARQRLDDLGGDTGTVPVGYTYYYEYSDTSCLWTNAELTGYANSSCNELAHRVPIRDSSNNELTRINLLAGQSRYELDPRILAVDSVVLGSTGVPLVKISESDDRSQWSDPLTTTYQDPTSVQQYRSDFDNFTLTVYSTPTVADTLVMAIRRLPMYPMTWVGRNIEIEDFSEPYQAALIDWMCMLAFLKRDTDTLDVEASGRHQGLFSEAVGPRINFKHQQVLKDVAGKRLRTRACW